MTFDLKTSLDDLAAAEYADAPASTVNIDRARADGRRRMLAARVAPVGGGVAVVAACALVVNGLGGTSPAKTNAPAPSAPARPAFTGTDPLTAAAKFGWLPEGYVTASYTTGGDYGDAVLARTKEAPSSTPVTPSRLALSSSPTEPQLRRYETKTPVTVAGSQKAYMVTDPSDGRGAADDLWLEWQTASGSWLALGDYNAIHGADLQKLLIKVAESVSADGAAVPLPIHIEGLPEGAALGAAMLNDPVTVGSDGFTLGLSYHGGATASGTKGLSSTASNFSISVAPTGQQDSANTQGHGAIDPNAAAKAGIKVTATTPAPDACKDSKGLHICVQDDPNGGPDPLASVGGAQGLLDRITSLGTDSADWTTHVVN